MGIIALASGNSCWRGLDYYKNKKVIKLNKINENEFSGIVKGTNNYNVHLDIEHPRKSSCDCPLANGKRIICKHIVATYFSALPKEAKNFEEEQIKLQEEYEKEHLRNSKKVHLFIRKMENEDTVTLPYTYFGLGTFTNERDSYTEEDGRRHSTLLYDIVLDDKVPEEYHIDFEIPNN